MEKKVSVPVMVTSIIIAVLLTFIVTFTLLKLDDFTALFKPGDANGTNQENASGIEKTDSDDESYLSTMEEIKAYFDNLYIGEIDETELSDMIAAGYVAGTGDKYAAYYNAQAAASLKEDMQGDMQGIGVSVIYNADEKAIEVINVFPDSPALESGVEVGDLIVYVGDELESVASLGYNAAVKKVQGPSGTIAKFVVYRGDPYEEITFEIPRRAIKEQTVEHRIYSLDKTVGIIKITSFDTGTIDQFMQAYDELIAAGADKIVFDVRNNPGGELKSICTILDFLLPEGPIIRTVDKAGNEEQIKSDAKEVNIPMAVVVNSNTASAAELFSSSLQDYKKAKIVGTVTYGKGCMQTIYDLSNGGCLSLTTALYNPPFSDNYDGIGVQPDIVSELSEEAAAKNIYKLTDEEDSQLADAVASLYGNK